MIGATKPSSWQLGDGAAVYALRALLQTHERLRLIVSNFTYWLRSAWNT